MRTTNRLHRVAATAAVAAGAGLLSSAFGGLADVDAKLQAVTDARLAEDRPVVFRTTYGGPWSRAPGGSEDCAGSGVAAREV